MIRRFFVGAGLVALLLGALATRFSIQGSAGAYSPLADLTPSTNGIHLAMLFNYNVHNHIAGEQGKVDYVWSADDYWAMKDVTVPGVKHDWYTFFTRDDKDDSKHDLAWFQANHPDWIEYRCDRTTPLSGNNWTEYNIANSAIQNYEMSYITQAMDGGYNGVGFDVTDTFNYDHACGHYNASGHWVQQYSGAVVDQRYRHAIIKAFSRLSARIRADAQARGIPFTIGINATFNLWAPVAQTEDLFPYADVVLDEAGLTNYGDDAHHDRVLAVASDAGRSQWLTKMRWYHDLHRMGKALIINGSVPYTVDAAHPATEADRQWIMANYLLAKDAHTYEALITGYQQYGGPYYPQPEYHLEIGSPLGGMHLLHGIWARNYSGGLALVNPSSSRTFRVRLPSAGFTDSEGHSVGRFVTLKPASGLILLINHRPASTLPPRGPQTSGSPQAEHRLLHLIKNGGFGRGTSGWRERSLAGRQIIDNLHPHTGTFGGDLCGYAGCAERLSQPVTLPKHFTRATVRYWLQTIPAPGLAASTPTTFYGQVRDARGRLISTFTHLQGAMGAMAWTHQGIDLTSVLRPYHGKTVRLVFGARATSAYPAHIYLDGISLNAAVHA